MSSNWSGQISPLIAVVPVYMKRPTSACWTFSAPGGAVSRSLSDVRSAFSASSVASCGSKVGLSTSLPKPRVIGKKLVVAGLPAAPRMA